MKEEEYKRTVNNKTMTQIDNKFPIVLTIKRGNHIIF